MTCNLCVFRPQDECRTTPPCNSCDGRDRGFCLASLTPQGYRPVVSNLFDEVRARELIAIAASNGTILDLFCWSRDEAAYLPMPL